MRKYGNVGEIQEMEWLPSMSTSPTKVLPLLSLNHVSFARKSVRLYEQVLGFVLSKRLLSTLKELGMVLPSGCSTTKSASICSYQKVFRQQRKKKIIPKGNHISLQGSDMKLVMKKLEKMKIEYVMGTVEEGGIQVNQLFFHDPDGYMVEICQLPKPSYSFTFLSPSTPNDAVSSLYGKQSREASRSVLASILMENLAPDLLNI